MQIREERCRRKQGEKLLEDTAIHSRGERVTARGGNKTAYPGRIQSDAFPFLREWFARKALQVGERSAIARHIVDITHNDIVLSEFPGILWQTHNEGS